MVKYNNVELAIKLSGVEFEHPFSLASGPPTATGEMIRAAFKRGWAGAVTKTICTDGEGIKNVAPRFATLAAEKSRSRSPLGFENIELISDRPAELWWDEIAALRKEFPEQVITASIAAGGDEKTKWQILARAAELAGAQILELNMSCPHGLPEQGMGAALGQDPELAGVIIKLVKEAVTIPVYPKLTPNITDIAIPALACQAAGADGVSAINTITSIAGVDLETMTPKPSVAGKSSPGGYSGSAVKPIALAMICRLYQKLNIPVWAMGGITNWQDSAEFLLLGASGLQICTAVMCDGLGIIDDLTSGLSRYMKEQGIDHVEELVGKSADKIIPFGQLEVDSNVKATINESTCIACGRCIASCHDGGFQAIDWPDSSDRKAPLVDHNKCTGCSLCCQVCPVKGCITLAANLNSP